MENNQIPIRCSISTSDPTVALTMRVALNGHIVMETAAVTGTVEFEHWIYDAEQQYELTFEMTGKTQEHTVLDESGAIVQDAHLNLCKFSIDDVDIVDWSKFDYNHNFNGTGDAVTDKFYGYMGCNGTVTVKFSTPIYLWLLENL
jgi:hypothetical protein